MSKEAWITNDVASDLEILALLEPPISMDEIRGELVKKFSKRYGHIPARSTIEKRVRQIRNKAREREREREKRREQGREALELNSQPWSMQLNEKAGIPFDPMLLQLLKLWFRQQVKRGQGPPFVPFSVGIAKWAVRLHKMVPFLVEEDEQQLLYRARRYFAMERMAALTGMFPDSSYDDMEIAMMDPETDPKLKAAYEQFYGSKAKVIRLEGEEV